MPAFSYVASIIVAEVIGIAGAAVLGSAGLAFVTSAVALGLAYGTAKLLGVGGTGGAGGTSQDPGVRIQFPPATNNKIPIVYGSANTKGVITDARISNGNQTMTYVLVLSEKTQTGTFTIGDVYWNDQKLIFNSTAGSRHIVESSIDQNGTGDTNTNYANLIRMRVYAGSTTATSQVFPLSDTPVSALTMLGETDPNYELNDLVFAVVQCDYSSEKGITGLGQITFQVNNTLKNPALVWYDYITDQRYGAGVPTAQINTATSTWAGTTTSLYSISNEIPANQFESDGTTTSTQVRYEINGVLSSGDTVKNNLEKIGVACASWNTFDYSEGRWKIIPNRALSAGELATTFEFNDDNILGEVGITATNLEDLYNILEVEFPSRKIRDQNDYFRGAIDPAERNTLEPDNTLNMRIDLVNNALHAARVGLIELKQSRVDLIITFRADYSAIQCEAGDVVKITNAVYGFVNKLFRITKIREVEDENGGLSVEITALEYDADVYIDEILTDSAAVAGSGIPTFGGTSSLPAPSAPVVIAVTTGTSPNFTVATTISTSSSAVDEIQWFYNTTSTGSFSYLTNEYNGAGSWVAGSTVTDVITVLGAGSYYFRARAGLGGQYSNLSTTSTQFVWDPTYDYGTLP